MTASRAGKAAPLAALATTFAATSTSFETPLPWGSEGRFGCGTGSGWTAGFGWGFGGSFGPGTWTTWSGLGAGGCVDPPPPVGPGVGSGVGGGGGDAT